MKYYIFETSTQTRIKYDGEVLFFLFKCDALDAIQQRVKEGSFFSTLIVLPHGGEWNIDDKLRFSRYVLSMWISRGGERGVTASKDCSLVTHT